MNTNLRIVRLMNPSICLTCRFAKISVVTMSDDTTKKMLHCTRLDCDNWQAEQTEEVPTRIEDTDE